MPRINVHTAHENAKNVVLHEWEEIVGQLKVYYRDSSVHIFHLYIPSKGDFFELKIPINLLCLNEKEIDTMKTHSIGILRCGLVNERYMIRMLDE